MYDLNFLFVLSLITKVSELKLTSKLLINNEISAIKGYNNG